MIADEDEVEENNLVGPEVLDETITEDLDINEDDWDEDDRRRAPVSAKRKPRKGRSMRRRTANGAGRRRRSDEGDDERSRIYRKRAYKIAATTGGITGIAGTLTLADSILGKGKLKQALRKTAGIACKSLNGDAVNFQEKLMAKNVFPDAKDPGEFFEAAASVLGPIFDFHSAAVKRSPDTYAVKFLEFWTAMDNINIDKLVDSVLAASNKEKPGHISLDVVLRHGLVVNEPQPQQTEK